MTAAGTTLTKVGRQDFAVLSGEQSGELKEAMQAMSEAGVTLGPKDLLRIKVPTGGETQWRVGDQLVGELQGAFVYLQRCSLLWPSEDSKKGQLPVLRSMDGIVGERVGPMPEDMAKLLEPWKIDERTYQVSEASGFPYSQWDTGKNGRGKRIKDQRLVFLLRPEDVAPMLVIVPPASLKQFDRWFNETFQITKVPYYKLLIGLSLQKAVNPDGQDYATITPRVVGLLDTDTAKELQATWGKALRDVAQTVAVEPPQ